MVVPWNESVLEKPESIANPDVGSVRSTEQESGAGKPRLRSIAFAHPSAGSALPIHPILPCSDIGMAHAAEDLRSCPPFISAPGGAELLSTPS